MKTKCYSVRLESVVSISPLALKVRSFDGREDVIPKSQFFGDDWEVSKSNAYWISAWILEKKSIQYSKKKVGWYNKQTGKIEPNVVIEKHVPKRILPQDTKPDESLTR